jgi:hypothetical protein
MAEKLPHQRVAVPLSLGQEHDPGSKPIDAVYDKCLLSLPPQFSGEKRPRGGRVRAFYWHSRKTGGFIDSHDSIVFVEHGEFPGEARPVLSS